MFLQTLWRNVQYLTLFTVNLLKVMCNSWWITDLSDSNSDLMLRGSLQKVWARQGKKEKDSRCTWSSPASGPGRSAIAVEHLESRFVRVSATSTPASCMYATDGPIRRWLPAAQGRCPGLLDNCSEAELEPSWRSKAVKWLVQLKLLSPPKSLLWWHFWGTSKCVDKFIDIHMTVRWYIDSIDPRESD